MEGHAGTHEALVADLAACITYAEAEAAATHAMMAAALAYYEAVGVYVTHCAREREWPYHE